MFIIINIFALNRPCNCVLFLASLTEEVDEGGFWRPNGQLSGTFPGGKLGQVGAWVPEVGCGGCGEVTRPNLGHFTWGGKVCQIGAWLLEVV